MRKAITRRTVDFNATIISHLEVAFARFSFLTRSSNALSKSMSEMFPLYSLGHRTSERYASELSQENLLLTYKVMPAAAYEDNPVTSMCTKFVHTSINKMRCPINAAAVCSLYFDAFFVPHLLHFSGPPRAVD